MGNSCCGSARGVANDEPSAAPVPFPKRAKTKSGAKADEKVNVNSTAAASPPASRHPSLAGQDAPMAPGPAAASAPAAQSSESPPPSPRLLGRPPMSAAAALERPAGPLRGLVPAGGDGVGGGRWRRPRRLGSPRLVPAAAEELFTDTFQISATTASEDDEPEDCFSVDVSQPTHSVLFLDRLGHARTLSDATSEVDFTQTTLDRTRGERGGGRGLAVRDLVAMEAERRARVVRAAQTARRGLWKSLCREQAMYERAAMLQRFFLERLALMLWETVAQESVTRGLLHRAESRDWQALAAQHQQHLEDRPQPESRGLTSATVAGWKGSLLSSQHAWDSSVPGTRANGTTTDVDLTSTSSFDEEEGSSFLLRPAVAVVGRPPSSLRLTSPTPAASARPGTSPAAPGSSQRGRSGAASTATDDLWTAGSTSLDHTTRPGRRGVSPVAADPRRVVHGKRVARVEGTMASSSGRH